MSSDRVQRLDPATGKVIEYLLPYQTNIRRIFIDNSTPRPTFWAGNITTPRSSSSNLRSSRR